MRRDPLGLYANLVPKNVEENHINSDASIDLNSIKSKVLDGQCPNLCVFILDALLLCINSLNSNPPGSIFSTVAKKMLNNLNIMEKRAMNWMTTIKKEFQKKIEEQMNYLNEYITTIKTNMEDGFKNIKE